MSFPLKDIIEHHAETIAAFAGGSAVALWGWFHIDPFVLAAQVFTTFLLGMVGGVAGVFAKFVCNIVTGKNKRKPPR